MLKSTNGKLHFFFISFIFVAWAIGCMNYDNIQTKLICEIFECGDIDKNTVGGTGQQARTVRRPYRLKTPHVSHIYLEEINEANNRITTQTIDCKHQLWTLMLAVVVHTHGFPVQWQIINDIMGASVLPPSKVIANLGKLVYNWPDLLTAFVFCTVGPIFSDVAGFQDLLWWVQFYHKREIKWPELRK